MGSNERISESERAMRRAERKAAGPAANIFGVIMTIPVAIIMLPIAALELIYRAITGKRG